MAYSDEEMRLFTVIAHLDIKDEYNRLKAEGETPTIGKIKPCRVLSPLVCGMLNKKHNILEEKSMTPDKKQRRFIFCLLLTLMLCLAVTAASAAGTEEEIASPDALSFSVTGDVRRVGDYLYRVLEDGTAEIVEYLSDQMITEIPSMLAGHPVSAVGDYAFANDGEICTYTDDYPDYLRKCIQTIQIPEGVVRIGEYAFSGCFNLKQIVLPNSLRSIGKGAFTRCKQLMNVALPEQLEELGDYAFEDCYTLVSINIPKALENIGANPFANCWNLYRVGIAEDHPFLKLENGMLIDTRQMKLIWATKEARGDLVMIPEGIRIIGDSAFDASPAHVIVIPDTVTAIENYAFADCVNLRDLVIPESVQSLGNNPFKGCVMLRTVTFRDRQSRFCLSGDMVIDREEGRLIAYLRQTRADSEAALWYAAAKDHPVTEKVINGQTMRLVEYVSVDLNWAEKLNLPDLEQVTVPEEISIIGAYAFYGAGVQEIILPESVCEIGEFAFAKNKKLEKCLLPEGIRVIPDGAFRDCRELRDVNLPDGLVSIGAWAFANTGLHEVVLPSTVESLGRYVFSECESMERITLSDALTSIPRGAFHDCWAEEIRLPDSIREIGAEAFSRMLCLKEIQLPEGMTCIADYCFFDTCLQQIDIPKSVTYIGNMAFMIDYYSGGNMTGLELPEGLLFIGSRAFDNQGSLKEITLPGGILGIGDRTFEYCSELESAVLSVGITEIPDRMFNRCESLREISIPKTVSRIGTLAFEWSALESLVLPSGYLQLDGNPFANCKSLESVKIVKNHPNLTLTNGFLIDRQEERLIAWLAPQAAASCIVPKGIRSIGSFAFSGRSELLEVVLPDSVMTIDEGAFEYCRNLENIRLPEHLERIGADAFASTGLKEIQLPETLRYIGAEAFDFTELSEVSIPEATEEIGEYAFSARDLRRITFPASAIRLDDNPLNPYVSQPAEVILPADHPTLEIEDGCLYDKTDGRLLARLSDGLIREGTVEITPHAMDSSLYGVLPDSLHVFPCMPISANGSSVYASPGSYSEAFFEAVMNYW